MAVATQSLEELCINSIRFLAIDAVERQSLVTQATDGRSSHGICAMGSLYAV